MTLEEACKAFSDWRSNKRSRSERIPERLWVTVKELRQHYNDSTLRKALHLSGDQFKKYCFDVVTSAKSIDNNDGFVEALLPMPTANCELTLQGRRKTLSIKIPPQQLSIVLPLLESY